MLSTDNDILKAAEDWRKQGRAVALATVVETWGSAPRPVGANLVIDQEEWGGFSRSTKMSEFEIVLRSHVIRGNSKSGASEFLDELTLAFKRNKEKGELWEMNTSKGSQVINLSQLQIAEAWEKDD